jgi:CRISPR-associated endonuclease/helicase Cas3
MDNVINQDAVCETKRSFIAHLRKSDGAIQELDRHLIETAFLAGKFASKIGLSMSGELIGLLHDLGKASIQFVNYINSALGYIDPDEDDYVDANDNKGKIDHSTSGAQVIFESFTTKERTYKILSEILSLVIASHHSGLIDCLTPDGKDNYSRRLNKSDDLTRKKESFSNIGDPIKNRIKNLLDDPLLLSEFIKYIDRLKEAGETKKTINLKLGLSTRFLFSCLIDADRINTADFEQPERAVFRNQGVYVKWQALCVRIENYISSIPSIKPIDHIRCQISDDCLKFAGRSKGIYQLTIPTGGGKTLSSLRFALHHAEKHCMDRVIYVIPYTSIIDQNAQKARDALESDKNGSSYSESVVLEHHSNLTPEEESTRQKLLSENWDAPLVFTTMVQFLETLFGYGTRNPRRMHQLANSVIIFDEIQTLPVKCVHLFNLAIRFLVKTCGSTVVLCTATQPLLDRVLPPERALRLSPEQQIVKDTDTLYRKLKRVEVHDLRRVCGWSEDETADLALGQLHKTGSVLIVVNTKKAAMNLYLRLKGCIPAETYHLSTNMCPAHRLYVLDEIKKCLDSGRNVVCVSTQLIEAGIDIDFGSVIRYLAGLDSIAQAAGRCNRNGLMQGLGQVFVINPREENLEKLIDINEGRKIAERVLDEFKSDPSAFDGDLLSPPAMERYYQYYYYARKEDMTYTFENKNLIGRADNLFNLLSNNELSLEEFKRINNTSPNLFMHQSFMTAAKAFKAIDSVMRGVIVPYGEEGKRLVNDLCASPVIEKEYKLLRKAQRYSVNLYNYAIDKLVSHGVIREVQEGTGILYLFEHYYSDEFGVSAIQINESESLII